MFNLTEFMDNRGTFKEVTFGDVTLQIASLSDDLIEQLKAIKTSEMMIDFVAEHGPSIHRERISEGDKVDDLPVIWGKSQMKAVKGQIVDAVLELSDIEKLITIKEDEELAVIEAEEEEKEDEEEEDDATGECNGDGEFSGTATLGGVSNGSQAANV